MISPPNFKKSGGVGPLREKENVPKKTQIFTRAAGHSQSVLGPGDDGVLKGLTQLREECIVTGYLSW